jgi:hypothetical protein
LSIAVARSRHWQIASARNCAGISSTSPPSHASQDAVKLRGDAVPFFASGPTPLSIPATPSTLLPRRPPLCLRGELLVLVDPFSLSFAFRIIVLVLVARAVPSHRRAIADLVSSDDLDVAATPIYGSKGFSASSALSLTANRASPRRQPPSPPCGVAVLARAYPLLNLAVDPCARVAANVASGPSVSGPGCWLPCAVSSASPVYPENKQNKYAAKW